MADEDKKDLPEEETSSEKENSEDDTSEDGESPAPKSKRKLIFIAAGAVSLIAIIGIVLFLFVFKSSPEEEPSLAEIVDGKDINSIEGSALIEGPSVYKDLEQKSINLLTNRGNRFLKIKLSLEYVGPIDEVAYAEVLPRIDDEINTYLRQRRPEDFKGTGNVYKIKEDLLLRLGQASYPLRLRNVLFRELVVQ